MEHLCYRCGAAVEDGIPFCPQCGAPQIRVAGPEPAVHSQTHGESYVSPPEAPVSLSAARFSQSSAPVPIEWSHALSAAAWAGLIAAFVLMLPLAAFGFGMLAAGALTVVFYRRQRPETEVTPAAGAKLGAVSGVLGFAVLAILMAVGMSLFHMGDELRATFLDTLQQSAAHSASPEAQQLVQFFKSPAGFAAMLVAALVVMFLAFIIFSSLGGALGAALLRRKNRS